MNQHDDLQELFRVNRRYFVAFGDYRRQDVLIALWENKDMTVKQLAELLDMPRPTVSHHIKILKESGLLSERNEGVRTYYRPAVKEAVAQLRQFLDEVDTIIDE